MGNTTSKFHPLTGALIVPLGYLPNGRTIWPIMGGDDTVPTAEEKAAADQQATDDKAAADKKAADEKAAADKRAAEQKAGEADQPLGEAGKRALDAEREARKAAEQAKTQAEQQRQEMLDGIAKALGIKSDDTPPDPAELQRTLGERETRVTDLEGEVLNLNKELAAWRVAAQQGVNAASLMDSRSFLNEVSRLDPTADNFTTSVEQAVRHAVEQNPALRGTASAGHAGIGSVGSADADAAATPGLGRLRQAYSAPK